MKIFDFLPGYKTYMVGFGAIATGVGMILTTGDITTEAVQFIMMGLASMTIRKAVDRA